MNHTAKRKLIAGEPRSRKRRRNGGVIQLRCTLCGKYGHIHCPHPKCPCGDEHIAAQHNCTHCGEVGHLEHECPWPVCPCGGGHHAIGQHHCVRCRGFGHIEYECPHPMCPCGQAHTLEQHYCLICEEQGHLAQAHFCWQCGVNDNFVNHKDCPMRERKREKKDQEQRLRFSQFWRRLFCWNRAG